MKWTIVVPGCQKLCSRLDSPISSWVATWGSAGLFRVSLLKGEDPGVTLSEVPVWLGIAWECLWKGDNPVVPLCTERPPKVTTGKVWTQVLDIPFGETSTYGEVGALAGIHGGARAVGAIMRANPWALFLPCHRVIGSRGEMRGYGGSSGVGLKSRLLEYEMRIIQKKKGAP
jgi:methylated-DNA-[protein]-cysteine S-methyltransferase